MRKIYDSKHQQYTIRNWMRIGLVLREGETYKDIYAFVMSIDNCKICSVKFNNEVYSEKRCMDHCHRTGYFRQVLCMKCNKQFDRAIKSKTGHRWISPHIQRKNDRKNTTPYVIFQYARKGFKPKGSTSLTKLIAYSFIQLLKIDHPLLP